MTITQHIQKGHKAVKKAMASHTEARAAHRIARAHLNDAIEHVAAAKSAVGDHALRDVAGHTGRALAAMDEAQNALSKSMRHSGDVSDMHTVADSHLSQADADWDPAADGDPDLGPGQPQRGVYSLDPGIDRLSQSERTEGDVFDMDPAAPYPGKALTPQNISRVRSILAKSMSAEAVEKTIVDLRNGKISPDVRRALAARAIGKMNINRIGARNDLGDGFARGIY